MLTCCVWLPVRLPTIFQEWRSYRLMAPSGAGTASNTPCIGCHAAVCRISVCAASICMHPDAMSHVRAPEACLPCQATVALLARMSAAEATVNNPECCHM